jgi:hypothetical protein
LARDGRVKPLSLRTNCKAEARISSSVAGGLKLCSVLMLRHMAQPHAGHGHLLANGTTTLAWWFGSIKRSSAQAVLGP